MALVIERKLFATGDSLAITIPKDWTKQFGLKAGANVEIVLGDELVIIGTRKQLRVLEGSI